MSHNRKAIGFFMVAGIGLSIALFRDYQHRLPNAASITLQDVKGWRLLSLFAAAVPKPRI